MPTYAFVCSQCGREFEELVAMGRIAPCPRCKSDKHVTKQLTAPAAVGASGNADARPDASARPCGSACACHPH
jgi:putative FmdB family regulatory protein